MDFYDKEILKGLEKIPTPNSPGLLIVTGDSQSVLTGSNAGDTFLAACKYGNGKIFVAAHNCYLDWIHDRNDPLKKDFINNLKIWLTGEKIYDSKIIDFALLVKKKFPFSNYKLIKWDQNYDPTLEDQANLLNYIDNGGALMCGSTPWGYLQVHPDRQLNDMSMYRFLKDYTGIILSPESLSLPDSLNVLENKAKHSHFDIAIEKVCSNPNKIGKYFNTLIHGLYVLNEEGLISTDKIIELKNIVCDNSKSCGLNTMPNGKNPIRKKEEKDAVKLLGKCFHFSDGEKAPGIKYFPGDFEDRPVLLENIELVLEAKFEEIVSTGYYLPAGVNLLLNVCNGDLNNWKLRIGAHTDDLSDCETFQRWPCVTIVKSLSPEMSVFSPFGGLVYFESNAAGALKVNITNVVESPYIDLNIPETLLDWNRRRNAPGLWAELAGENVIFTTQSSSIRHLENPKEVLQFWDTVIRTHHECRGTNVNDYRRERIVNDKQPSVGYMHSGYPIVTHLDCCQPDSEDYIFNLEKLKSNGSWGLFHEIGHNLQRDEWTFEGAEEVTVNIFSMHAFQFIIGKDVIDQDWLKGQKEHFDGYFYFDPTYEDWQEECGMALLTFAQLIKHFGWSPMHKFMKDYEYDINNHQEKLPKSNQEKIDQWVIRYSKLVSKNIAPQFKMFGLPVSDYVNDELVDLEEWCPSHEKDPNLFFSKLE